MRIPRPNIWRAEEDALLRERYPAGGVEACVLALPRRTAGAIMGRVSFLKVKLDPAERSRRYHQGRAGAPTGDQPLVVDDTALREAMCGLDALTRQRLAAESTELLRESRAE